ncbi:MAG: Smr/MutS family protein [Proteobacteria bacterium]|nr:Smr/MutS family protein [Pseudomonadota bacterium]MBS0573257.1 Smr/MutS family protein [Pseudomonadota bacterium]
MSRRPRGLRPEERELWQMIAKSTRALHPERPARQAPPEVPATPRPAAGAIPAFHVGERLRAHVPSHDLVSALHDRLAAQPLRMDRKTFEKMARGKLTPDARIDLHGMTLAEAHGALVRFVQRAHAGGLRLVLVITGKGKRGEDAGPIPARVGALRHQVPQWLALPPLGSAILQVAPANLKHGGQGAYYVYLRRAR